MRIDSADAEHDAQSLLPSPTSPVDAAGRPRERTAGGTYLMTDDELDRATLAAVRRVKRLRRDLEARREGLRQMVSLFGDGVPRKGSKVKYDPDTESVTVDGRACRWPSVEAITTAAKAVFDLEEQLGEAEEHLDKLDPDLV